MNAPRCAPPLPQKDIMAQHGVRLTEAAVVDEHFPSTSAKFDQSPHVCKGSETLAPLLLQELQQRGYLIMVQQVQHRG